MIHKPIVGPSKDEWDAPAVPSCQHDLPFSITCGECQENWRLLALWGELMDEA